MTLNGKCSMRRRPAARARSASGDRDTDQCRSEQPGSLWPSAARCPGREAREPQEYAPPRHGSYRHASFRAIPRAPAADLATSQP